MECYKCGSTNLYVSEMQLTLDEIRQTENAIGYMVEVQAKKEDDEICI